MKKIVLNLLLAVTLCSSLSSCATVFGGKITQAQRTRPAAGEPTRPVRAVALIADIVLFWPGLIVDFVTGAIYKPERKAPIPETKTSTAEVKAEGI